MRFDISNFPKVSEIFSEYTLDKDGFLSKADPKARQVRTAPELILNGRKCLTRYAAYARLWGHYPEFQLRAHPTVKDPVESRAADWVEVPKDEEAPTTGPNPEYYMVSPLTGKTRIRIVPRRLENSPIAYRYVRQRQFDPGKDSVFDSLAQEWQEAVLQELKSLAGDEKHRQKEAKGAGRRATQAQVRKPAKVLDHFLVDRPPQPQPNQLHPLEQWHLLVDDGGDPAGVNTTPPSPLKPQQQTVQVPTIDPGKLPTPLTQPVNQMDMTSYKAAERLLGVAARLSGRAQNAPVHFTLTLGPLDGCWKTYATTTDPTSHLPLQDVRESQPGALLAARDKGWDFQISRTIKSRLTMEEIRSFRREVLKKWDDHAPPPGAIRAAQAAWTATPTPRLGGDLRRAPEASQMPSTVLNTGQESPSFNLELVLETLAAPGGDPLNFALWTPPNRGGAQSGLSLRVNRTTHSFEFTLVGRPHSDPEGQYRIINTFRLPSRISAKKLTQMPKRRIFVSNAATRPKLLALAPQIVKAIKTRLTEEREFYTNQPKNNPGDPK
jgi:hypothetical protein